METDKAQSKRGNGRVFEMPEFADDEFWSINQDMVQALLVDMTDIGLWKAIKPKTVVLIPKRMDPTVPLTAWVYDKTPEFEEAMRQFEKSNNKELLRVKAALGNWRYVNSTKRDARRKAGVR